MKQRTKGMDDLRGVNMVRNSNGHVFSVIGLIAGMVWAQPSLASFDVFDDQSEGYYGNAEKRSFKDDVEGTDALSPNDRAFLDSVEINRITQRWYMRALVGKPKMKLSDIQNNSSEPYDQLAISTTSVTQNLYQLLVAGGYLYENWAIEGELFFTKQMDYNSSPFFSSGFGGVAQETNIRQIALLLNLQYILPRYFDWYPQHLQIHFDAGAGPILKKTNTQTYTTSGTPLLSGSAQTIAAAGKLGLGGRYQVSTHFLVDISYNYLFLGKTNFGPVGPIKAKSTDMQSNGFFFGLTYQF